MSNIRNTDNPLFKGMDIAEASGLCGLSQLQIKLLCSIHL